MIRFQQFLPAFIGFFIVGVIIGLLIDGIALGIILGLLAGSIATAIFWRFAQDSVLSQPAGSTSKSSNSTSPQTGGYTSVEDVLQVENVKKRKDTVKKPSRGLTDVDADGDQSIASHEVNVRDTTVEEEFVDDDEFFDGVVAQETLGSSEEQVKGQKDGRRRSATEVDVKEPDPETSSNRAPGDNSTIAPPPKIEPEFFSEGGETALGDKLGTDIFGGTLTDRLDDTSGNAPILQPQAPPKPTSTTPIKPDSTPSLGMDVEKSVDDEWVPVEETVEEEPPEEKEEEPAVAAENVHFTLYHPKEATVEQWYSLLTYIHIESAVEAVQADAKKFTAELTHDHREIRSRKTAKLTRGTEIRLVPHADGLEFNPSSISITWIEDFHRADFRFRATKDLLGEPVLGELTVYVGPLEIANLRFSIFVTDAQSSAPELPEPDVVHGEMYKSIFASYSHSDTLIVQACVAAFKAIGYDVLIDYEALRSGEDWSEALERLIDEADIFQLFWSSNAAKSKFVQQEWEHALKRPLNNSNLKVGEGFIRPVYWEQPIPNIPEVLSHIHFKYLADLAKLNQ